MGVHLLVDLDDGLPPRHSNKAQSNRAQPEADEPPSQGGQYVILPLRQCRRQDLDLPAIETDALVEPADVVALSLRVREEDLGWAGLQNDVAPRRVHHVCDALAHEDYRGILLAQRP